MRGINLIIKTFIHKQMNAKTIQKYKDKNYSNLHKTAKLYFHKYIRLRDTDDNGNGFCISSSRYVKYGTKNCQAGHYYPVGTYKALEFDENNVHVQDLSDNYYRAANIHEYRPRLIKKIGETAFNDLVFKAERSKRITFNQDRFLMIEIIEKYKVKCKELASEKMFEVK